MEPVTGPSSILLLDGERHLRMRKLMLPSFHGEAIARYTELIEDVTRREVDTWHEGEVIRTRTVAQRITMEVIIRAVFGSLIPNASASSSASYRGCPRPVHSCSSSKRTLDLALLGAGSFVSENMSTAASMRRSSDAGGPRHLGGGPEG